MVSLALASEGNPADDAVVARLSASGSRLIDGRAAVTASLGTGVLR
jgi:hypothetical protein